jgi:hypothetical protein
VVALDEETEALDEDPLRDERYDDSDLSVLSDVSRLLNSVVSALCCWLTNCCSRVIWLAKDVLMFCRPVIVDGSSPLIGAVDVVASEFRLPATPGV